MISFVVWKWQRPGFDRVFESSYVNVLKAMIDRHTTQSHRLICITDEPEGLDPDIETLPCPVHFHGIGAHKPRFPSCYRRLWNFSADACLFLGPKIIALDIDVVITGNLDALVSRHEHFVGWTDPAFGWEKVAGGLYLLRTGTMSYVWDTFDPIRSPATARAARRSGSDQGWLSYLLYPPAASFSRKEGVYAIKWLPEQSPLPAHVRIVSTAGHLKPWHAELQSRYPWIRDHWRGKS